MHYEKQKCTKKQEKKQRKRSQLRLCSTPEDYIALSFFLMMLSGTNSLTWKWSEIEIYAYTYKMHSLGMTQSQVAAAPGNLKICVFDLGRQWILSKHESPIACVVF